MNKSLGIVSKIGVVLLTLWGILHIFFGVEGIRQFLSGNVNNQWDILLGGTHGVKTLFQYPTDPATITIQSHLLLNFCLEIASYGLLSLLLAYMIWTKQSWLAYFVFLIVVGIAELSFLFNLVTTGIMELNGGSIGGPVLWLLAVLLIPFGMPKNKD